MRKGCLVLCGALLLQFAVLSEGSQAERHAHELNDTNTSAPSPPAPPQPTASPVNGSAPPTGLVDARCPPKDDGSEEGAEEWVKKGGVAVIVFGVLVSFWSLAVVVEEFFVPALNIMCEVCGIPDDVAGATFMAAGASSPEMFSAIISLFITHSALGAGTIIGSEIFNHLCICAGAVAYSKSGVLELEWRILLRECIFYALACGLLVFAMSETGDSDAQDCEDWTWVRWYHGLILIGGYVAYALVCSFYTGIRSTCCPMPEQPEVVGPPAPTEEGRVSADAEVVAVAEPESAGSEYARLTSKQSRARGGSRRGDGIEAAGNIALDPEEEVHAVDFEVETRQRSSSAKSAAQEPKGNFADPESEPMPMKRQGSFTSAVSNLTSALIPGLAKDKERFTSECIECYIWKKSRFYNAFRMTSKAWQMRWAYIDEQGFCYYRTPEGGSGRSFNLFQGRAGVEVTVVITDEQRNLFELRAPMNQKQQTVQFQAQNPEHTQKIVERLRSLIAEYRLQPGESPEQNAARRAEAWENAQRRAKTQSGDSPENVEAEAHEHESLIAWPDSCFGKICHVPLFPFKAMMHFSMVDVRQPGGERYWGLTCFMSVVWLAGMSYLMTFCVESLGKLFGISELVMGLTVSAAGTSFPNVFASMLVARQGYGNMAISNAFGSNVFNIFMGLGFPWFLVCLLGTSEMNVDGKVYHGMKQGGGGGVAFPVMILLTLLILFLLNLICTGWRIHMYHAYIFVAGYIGFLVWAFGWNAKGPDLGI
eukprot:Hpha_TRINITY_DN16778_c5_g1::TRINITY_DN16778_c5_g1_i1::g.77584::m.77584/K13750/SLC24A2, NCKX2; solute carrier family 24 (sodium/potassium/calcium exchanger), member 2